MPLVPIEQSSPGGDYVDVCAFVAMTPQRNRANEPGSRLSQHERWLQNCRQNKEKLKGAQRLLPQASLSDSAASDIKSAKNRLSQVLRWIEATNPRWFPYFGSFSNLRDSVQNAIGELIAALDMIAYYEKARNNYRERRTIEEIRANCIRELHKSLSRCRQNIRQALKEFCV